jgi:hypothetical protein
MTINDNVDKYRPEAVNFKRYGKHMFMVFKDQKLAEAIKRICPLESSEGFARQIADIFG